jgi:hypothetical protein
MGEDDSIDCIVILRFDDSLAFFAANSSELSWRSISWRLALSSRRSAALPFLLLRLAGGIVGWR